MQWVVLCLICGCIGAVIEANDKRKEKNKEKKKEKNRLKKEKQELEDQREYEKEIRYAKFTEKEMKNQATSYRIIKKSEKDIEKQNRTEFKNSEGTIEYAYNLLSKNEDSSNKIAIESLKKLAKAGDKKAQQKLVDIYSIGEIVPVDNKEAEKWENMSGELSNTSKLEDFLSKETEKWMNMNNEPSNTPNFDAYISKLVKEGKANLKGMNLTNAAYAGYAEAQYELGVHYAFYKIYDIAVDYYKMAADQGLAEAQNKLGVCYQNGKGVNKDLKKATKYFKLAAEQGDSEAKENPKLPDNSGSYKKEKMTPENNNITIESAFKLLNNKNNEDNSKAIEILIELGTNGNRRAQQKLVDIYSIGEIVPVNDKEAEKWENYG